MGGLSSLSGLTGLAGIVGLDNTETAEEPMPRGYIDGLQLSTTAPHESLTIAPGVCRSNDNAMDLSLTEPLERSLGSPFPTGCRPASVSSLTAGQTLHIFVASYEGTTVALIDTQVAGTGAAAESGVTSIRRIGSLRVTAANLGSNQIQVLPFIQHGEEFLWITAQDDVVPSSTNLSSSPVTFTLSVPTGINALARVTGTFWSTANLKARLASPESDITLSDTRATIRSGGSAGNANSSFAVQVMTNTSGQIRAVADTGTAWLWLATIGYTDSRGRDL